MNSVYTQLLEFSMNNKIDLSRDQILNMKTRFEFDPEDNIYKTNTKIPEEYNFDLEESIKNDSFCNKLETIAIWLIDHDKEAEVSKVISNAYWKCKVLMNKNITQEFDQTKNYKLIFTPLAPLLKQYVKSADYQKIKDDIIQTIQLINDGSYPKPSEETFVRNMRDFSTIYVRDLSECLKIMQGEPKFKITESTQVKISDKEKLDCYNTVAESLRPELDKLYNYLALKDFKVKYKINENNKNNIKKFFLLEIDYSNKIDEEIEKELVNNIRRMMDKYNRDTLKYNDPFNKIKIDIDLRKDIGYLYLYRIGF